MVLPRSFYEQETITVAKQLLGKVLVHKSFGGVTAGKIVETEAYLEQDDPANHAARGQTVRNAAMFGPPGYSYIYLIYGMYSCFNVVTGAEGVGEAVLIRALEPLEGIDVMQQRRSIQDVHKLCNGPGKLVIAMGITKELYGHDLTQEP